MVHTMTTWQFYLHLEWAMCEEEAVSDNDDHL